MAPRPDDVEVLELRRRRQDDVGVRGGVGHELLAHDREQVVAAQAREHPLLIGRDRRRVRVPDDQRRDRRVERRIGERLADARHVERARRARRADAAARARASPSTPNMRRRDVREPAAAVPPGAGERRDAGDRAVGDRRAGVALRADAQADQRRLVAARARARARAGRPPGRRSAPACSSTRLAREALDQLVVAERVRAAPLLVGEPGVEQRAHDAERERGVGAGQRPQVHVGDARRAAAERVDDDQPRAALARLEDQPPEVRRRRERVPAPHDDRARVHPLLGVDLGRGAVRRHRARDARRSRRSCARASSRRARRAAGWPSCRPARGPACRGSCRARSTRRRAARSPRAGRAAASVERLVPARPAEAPLALGARAHERMQQALVRVHALEVVRDLAAQEAGRDRVLGVARDARGAALGIDLDEQRAGVGAIVRAGPADDSGGCAHGLADATPARAIPRGGMVRCLVRRAQRGARDRSPAPPALARSRFSAPRTARPPCAARPDDLLVPGAAAQVAAQRDADLVLARLRALGQQRGRGDQHARRAEAALDAALGDDVALQRVRISPPCRGPPPS